MKCDCNGIEVLCEKCGGTGKYPSDDIRKVTSEEAEKIIETRVPRGLFYTIEKDSKIGKPYVGIDNRDGDAWTEDFKSLSGCKRWLKE